MNILILGAMDCSGAGYALMSAINNTTNHKARMVILRQKWHRYPTDIIKPTRPELMSLLEWSDVLNFQVRGEELLPPKSPKRPAVKTYHGSEYRWRWKRENARAKRLGWLQTCMTIDLSQYGATWIGRAMPDLSHMVNQLPGFHIVHAAAVDRKKKANRKGTDVLQDALMELDGVTADIFREIPNQECLRRKAQAHLYVDQVGPRGLGYGTNALEAWAMGLPVIASAPDKIKRLMRDTIGYIPFCPCEDAETLRRRIVQFRDDELFRTKWALIGKRYLQVWHDPARVAARYVELFERAI
jgi:hypothetical protein